MKILLAILAALSPGSLAAAKGGLKTHKVVIQFTSEGDKQAEALLNNIENLFAPLIPYRAFDLLTISSSIKSTR